MARSNAPLALSVVTLTEPNSVDQTLFNITQFDDCDFGFSHDQTWAALPFALRGAFDPDAVAASFVKAPVRVQKCITALCRLGTELRLDTRRFVDYPSAGLRTIAPIDWDPEITVRVKGCCWYVERGRVIIPLLQPRKSPLTRERLSVYLRLGKQGFCQGDWIEAMVQTIDLSGDGEIVEARVLDEADTGLASDATLAQYVRTYTEAKRLADMQRAERPGKNERVDLPMDQFFDER